MDHLKNNWRTYYAIILAILLGVILYNRSSTFLSGDFHYLDLAVLILFTVLILSPLFKEIKFAGFSFKSEIRDFKNDIRDEILTLRTEINNNINVNPSFKFQFSPDAKDEIPEFTKQVKNPKLIEVPIEAVELFKMRYALETKLMDMAEEFYPETIGRDFTPLTEVILKLQRDKFIDKTTFTLTKEFLMITNSAIHGIIPSELDLKLARKLAPALLSKFDSLE